MNFRTSAFNNRTLNKEYGSPIMTRGLNLVEKDFNFTAYTKLKVNEEKDIVCLPLFGRKNPENSVVNQMDHKISGISIRNFRGTSRSTGLFSFGKGTL